MDINNKIELYLDEGIIADLKGAFNYYVKGVMAIEDVSKQVRVLAEKMAKMAEGKDNKEKIKIINNFKVQVRSIVNKSKMHDSMKIGYIEGMEKSFGKQVAKA